jgi:hypothetical protein
VPVGDAHGEKQRDSEERYADAPATTRHARMSNNASGRPASSRISRDCGATDSHSVRARALAAALPRRAPRYRIANAGALAQRARVNERHRKSENALSPETGYCSYTPV